MSKPVTNEEVEDVLSSIRRLVSEDKRPLAGLRSASVVQGADASEVRKPEAATETADRFVLTPALRVASRREDTPTDLDDGPLDLGSVTRRTWTDAADTTAQVGGDDHADKAPMMLFPSDAVASQRTDALVQDTLESESNDDALADGDYSDEGYWDVEEAPFHDTDERLSDAEDVPDWDMDVPEVTEGAEDTLGVRGATDEAVGTSDFVEKNTSDDDILQETVEQHEPIDGSKAISSEELFFEPDFDDSPEVDPQMKSTIPLTAKIAALEAAVGEITSGWEPDGDEIETLAASVAPAMAWEDDLQLDAKGAPLQDDAAEDISEAETEADETLEASASIGGFGADDQVMDEDALRTLVSEIVRAELQGALGERITRNVRKLVRREIHRALTAQEME